MRSTNMKTSLATAHTYMGLALALSFPAFAQASDQVEFEDPAIIVVYSASDEDAQIIASGGSEDGMAEVKIRGPRNNLMYKSKFWNDGNVGQADFQFDTLEPGMEELMTAYMEGQYRFRGWTVDGVRIASNVELSYDLPDVPVITFPMDGDEDIPTDSLKVTWTLTGDAEAILLELENEVEEVTLSVDLDSEESSFQIPDGWMIPGTEYVLDIKVIAENGNITVTDIRFTTAE